MIVTVLTKSKLSHKVFIPRRTTESSPWTRWTARRRARIFSDCVEVPRCVVLTVVPDVVIVILVVLYYIRHVVEPRGRSWLMLRCRHVIIASWTRIVDSDVTIVRYRSPATSASSVRLSKSSVTQDFGGLSVSHVFNLSMWEMIGRLCLDFWIR